jgi:serine/threonine protein kinase
MELRESDFVKYFDREELALRSFAHPGCLSYVSSSKHGIDGILLTSFQRNGNLETALKREANGDPLENWATKKTIIAFGVAFAMEHIHKRGFAHRDLKAANILLNERFEPVIGDFGLATNFANAGNDPDVGLSMAVGTPLHMALELWTDKSSAYRQEVDVYAFAILLYSLFVNDPTKELDDNRGCADKPRILLRRISNGARPKRAPTINDAYWGLITNGWDGCPATRMTFEAIVDHMVGNVTAFMIPGANEAEVHQYISDLTWRR